MITLTDYLDRLKQAISKKLPGHQELTVYEVTQKPDADNNKRVFHIRLHNRYVGIVIQQKDLERPYITTAIEGTARSIARKFRTVDCTHITPKREKEGEQAHAV